MSRAVVLNVSWAVGPGKAADPLLRQIQFFFSDFLPEWLAGTIDHSWGIWTSGGEFRDELMTDA